MNCEKVQEQFSEYREGALTEGMRLIVREHLTACSGCRTSYTQFEHIWGWLGDLEPDPVPANLSHYVSGRISAAAMQSEYASPFPWFKFLRNLAFAGAAATALFFAAFRVVPLFNVQSAGPGTEAVIQSPHLVSIEGNWSIQFDAKESGTAELIEVMTDGARHTVDEFAVPKGAPVSISLRNFAERKETTGLILRLTYGSKQKEILFDKPFHATGSEAR
jgi:hypothetical protein